MQNGKLLRLVCVSNFSADAWISRAMRENFAHLDFMLKVFFNFIGISAKNSVGIDSAE
jgi:hypothetical protein